MNRLIKILMIIITPLCCEAQFANVWCFGNHYKLDFNYAPPLFSDSATAILNLKGASSICDSLGQLLFYTDGTFVWNKLHQQMPNGNSMAYSQYIPPYYYPAIANESYAGSYQGAVIIPIENTTKYYIFTTDFWQSGPRLLRYHVVDLSLENGLGDVAIKNQIMDYPVGEKMAITRHCNGSDWWVVVHSIGTDEYHSFLVTNDSVSAIPVISHTGGFADSNLGEADVGQYKISPNGKFIAANYEIWGGMELGTFNNQTGEVEIVYSTIPSDTSSYGCAFSADSKFLYQSVLVPDQAAFDSTNFYPFHIYRYTLTNLDSASIAQSKFQLFEPDVLISELLTMQLAPDGNVYANAIIVDSLDTVRAYNHSELWIIKPNSDSLIVTGIVCNEDSTERNAGLPSYPDAIFTNHHKASLRIPTCLAGVYDSIPFDSLLTTTRDYIWDFGDPLSGINNTYNGQFPIHSFSAAGTYNVTLTLPSACNPITITQQVISNPTTANTPTITLNNTSLVCSAALQYQWYLNNNLISGATSQTLNPTSNGDYTVTISDSNYCASSSAVFSLFNVGITSNNPYQFSIYPNPAHGFIYLNNPEQKQAYITITDLLGNEIIKTSISKTNESIDINQLSNGLYLINIDTHFNQKLIVKK